MSTDILNYKMLPEEARDIVTTLTRAGYRVYIVGGAVRDAALGQTPKDLDFATDATPSQVLHVFNHERLVHPEKDFRLSFHGKCFGVCTVNEYEIATFRQDIHAGSGDKKCSVEYTMSLETDLSRRDFTINAMAYDPLTEELIDPFHGMQDIKDQILRAVGDPRQRIWEDPNRAYRAFRMAAVADCHCHESVFLAIQDARPLIRDVAPDRVRAEILKAMQTRRPSVFWNLMRASGLLEDTLPPMADMWNCDGGPCHGETVWDHAMLCGDALPKNAPLLRLSGYLHDIGKPCTHDREAGTFHSHMTVGSRIAGRMLSRLRFSRSEIEFVKCLIKEHMFDPDGPRGKNPNRAQKRLIRRLRSNGCRLCDWLRLHIADVNGNTATPRLSSRDIRELIKHFDGARMEDVKLSGTKDLPVNGRDVMSVFEMTVGTPLVGSVLKRVFEYAEEHPERATRDELIGYIEKIHRGEVCL